jgi:hypothetical protein
MLKLSFTIVTQCNAAANITVHGEDEGSDNESRNALIRGRSPTANLVSPHLWGNATLGGEQ